MLCKFEPAGLTAEALAQCGDELIELLVEDVFPRRNRIQPRGSLPMALSAAASVEQGCDVCN